MFVTKCSTVTQILKMTRFRFNHTKCCSLLFPSQKPTSTLYKRIAHYHIHARLLNQVVKPLYLHAKEHEKRTAIIDVNGTHTYKDLLHMSLRVSRTIDSITESSVSTQPRVVIFCPNNMSYPVSLLGIWLSRCIAVPLNINYPPAELKYFMQDSEPSLIITTEECSSIISDVAAELQIPLVQLKQKDYDSSIEADVQTNDDNGSTVLASYHSKLNTLDQLASRQGLANDAALIVYTSGTTGPPKGVVHTHQSLDAQMASMITEWDWKLSDTILHVLPLHHVHGIVNVLMTPLRVGACCYMLEKFDEAKVWSLLATRVSADTTTPLVSVFMAVPTIYAKLLKYINNSYKGNEGAFVKTFLKSACLQQIRLMVSGSAALPEPILEEWHELTGHVLLERYGMTEIGMATTQPLQGQRIPGAGRPFPNVELCIARSNVYSDSGYDHVVYGTKNSADVVEGEKLEPGELLVKGSALFKEYWNKPDATKAAFTKDGWFVTGDTVELVTDKAAIGALYRILGRTSVDVIKSGGYKISALDIEQAILAHPDVQEVAVVGLADITWGQKVAAVVVPKPGTTITDAAIREFLRDKVAPYKIPNVYRFPSLLTRNLMGKVNKKLLREEYFTKDFTKRK